MGGVTVCDRVCLSVVSTSSLLSCDKNQSSLVDETPGEGIYNNRVPFGGSVFRQIKGIQRKPVPTFAVFQMPLAQNNQYTKAEYLGAAPLQGDVGWSNRGQWCTIAVYSSCFPYKAVQLWAGH